MRSGNEGAGDTALNGWGMEPRRDCGLSPRGHCATASTDVPRTLPGSASASGPGHADRVQLWRLPRTHNGDNNPPPCPLCNPAPDAEVLYVPGSLQEHARARLPDGVTLPLPGVGDSSSGSGSFFHAR